MNDKIDIVITCSWRFECLNVMLDILKSNFSNNITTHVFCNLSEEMLKTYMEKIDLSLIDKFYHIPDKNCNNTITSKIEVRRRQPLDLFINTLNFISDNNDIERFVYTECDFFPVDEKAYFANIYKVDKEILCAGKIIKNDLVSSKTPKGYLCMSPLYFYNDKIKIKSLIDDLITNRSKYIAKGYAFEGMVCESFDNIRCEVYPTSKYFISNYEFDKNLDPRTLTTHQHNPLNLKHLFKKRNIKSGIHIKKVLSANEITEAYTKEVLQCDLNSDFKISLQKNQLQ